MMNDKDLEDLRADADLDTHQAAGDPDSRVEQLAADIDETRGDLTETITAIGQKLEPANLAREAGDTVRSATIGKVEQMSYGARETWNDVRTGNTGGIVDTITSNPVPAGMVALGLGMLFMNRGTQAHRRRASWQTERWDQPVRGSSARDSVGGTLSAAGETVGHAADEAGRKLTGVMDGVGEAAGELPQQAGQMVEMRAGQARRFFDEYPLGAGMIALAAGAAIGMMLPSTSLERDTLGQARDDLVSKAESGVHEALDKADEQIGNA